MTVDIAGIGTPKKMKPDHSEIQFESLSTYLSVARKMIITCAPLIRSGLKEEMLFSEDAISAIADSLMRADWDFDGRGNLSGYRSFRAMCAIKAYSSRQSRNNKGVLSLDEEVKADGGSGRRISLCDTIASSQREPYKYAQDNETRNLLNSKCITPLQRRRIGQYYLERRSMSEIIETEPNKCSRQAISYSIQDGMRNIKKNCLDVD